MDAVYRLSGKKSALIELLVGITLKIPLKAIFSRTTCITYTIFFKANLF